LKVIGVQRLVRRHVSRGRKRNCWRISLEQSLHRDTLISSTNVPVHAPMFLPLFRVSGAQSSGILWQMYEQGA
jgi:hypothetical protein